MGGCCWAAKEVASALVYLKKINRKQIMDSKTEVSPKYLNNEYCLGQYENAIWWMSKRVVSVANMCRSASNISVPVSCSITTAYLSLWPISRFSGPVFENSYFSYCVTVSKACFQNSEVANAHTQWRRYIRNPQIWTFVIVFIHQ